MVTEGKVQDLLHQSANLLLTEGTKYERPIG